MIKLPIISRGIKMERFIKLCLMGLFLAHNAYGSSEATWLTRNADTQDGYLIVEQHNGVTEIVYYQPLHTDADRDGVLDDLDACPQSAKNISVDATGCDNDFDKDGIKNSEDACPLTARNESVDVVGCSIQG